MVDSNLNVKLIILSDRINFKIFCLIVNIYDENVFLLVLYKNPVYDLSKLDSILILQVTILIIGVMALDTVYVSFAQPEGIQYDIAAVGDISCLSYDGKLHGKETISAIERLSPDLVIFLGDLAYAKDLDCFFNSTKSLEENNQVLVALGNHDIAIEGNEMTKRELMEKYGIPPEGYYDATFANGTILFVLMNYTGLEGGKEKSFLLEGSPQYTFVKQTLENSDAKYKIVVSHAPFKACDFEDGHRPLQGVYEAYNPLFQNEGVNLVVSAHNHNYQRYKVDNVTYVTSGLGGRSYYSVPEDYNEVGLEELFDIEHGYGFSRFGFSGSLIDCKFVSNSDNETDTFKIDLPNNARDVQNM
jgi:hypothetical protein